MPLFFHRKKTPPAPERLQPRPGLPWVLTRDAILAPDFDWDGLARGLEALTTDPDSFVILEQRGPGDWYWFLQCALAKMGPYQGQYLVECGYPTPGGPVLLQRRFGAVGEVLPLFADAYRRSALDLSGFEDVSRQLPANQ